eukprot:3044980-Karenia_brevis.AAC.1
MPLCAVAPALHNSCVLPTGNRCGMHLKRHHVEATSSLTPYTMFSNNKWSTCVREVQISSQQGKRPNYYWPPMEEKKAELLTSTSTDDSGHDFDVVVGSICDSNGLFKF